MILLVEDNRTIAENIVQYFALHDFRCDRCADGNSGLEAIDNKQYDLIILDVMLPGASGFEILTHLRSTKRTPVILTTAKGQIEDKSIGFEAGADDYLVKPFELKELLMRVQALINRTQSSDIITYKSLEINTLDNEVIKNGEKVKLTHKERLVLSALLDQEGHPISRSDISEFVRGGDSLRENDAKLDVYISNLRKKLDKELIETVKGFGYKIAK